MLSSLSLWTVFVVSVCILHLNATGTKRSNVVVTLHDKDVDSLFTAGEIWGIHGIESDIVEVEVVIDEKKLMKLMKLMKLTNQDNDDKDENNDPIEISIMAIDVIWADADEAILRERERINNTARWSPDIQPDIFFLEYRNWFEYELFIQTLVNIRFPELASLQYMDTTTVEGRDIWVVKLSTGTGPATKPGFYVQGCIHAREWLACAAVTKILNDLAEGYGTVDNITAILDEMDIFIVPVLNVDGYIYSWEVDRNWRKNRRENGPFTFGVDLNRNYDGPHGTWCTAGASSNPASDSYCGTAGYSEPETIAGTDFITKAENNIKAVFDLHTSGQYIMYPQAWTATSLPAPYNDDYARLAQKMSDAVFGINGYRYNPIQCAPTFLAAGSSIDFAWTQGADADDVIPTDTLGFGFEGRGPGFNPDPSNIIPGGKEQLQAVIVVAQEILGIEN